MTGASISELGNRARRLLHELARYSDDPERLSRLFLSPSHIQSVGLVKGWFEAAGLQTTIDPLLTVRGHRKAERPGRYANKRLLIGSHIDTVVDAGRYDGCLGVVAGLVALEELAARGIKLPFAVDLLAFGDEEGVRFPVTLTSSSAIAGTLTRGMLEARDKDGISIAEALAAAGGDAEAALTCAYNRDEVIGYLEVHIEQGPVLESERFALGVVTAIAGQSRFRISVSGEAGHAGTVPMHLRRDALAAAAEMMLEIEKVAMDGTPDALVATVGQIRISPGASNVVPGQADFTLDIRAANDPARLNAIAEIRRRCRAIAEHRHVGFVMQEALSRLTRHAGDRLQALLASGIAATGQAVRSLPSGAGHDGLAVADLAPIGMIFVRCRGGISHNPLESVETDDMGLAIEALVQSLIQLSEQEVDLV